MKIIIIFFALALVSSTSKSQSKNLNFLPFDSLFYENYDDTIFTSYGPIQPKHKIPNEVIKGLAITSDTFNLSSYDCFPEYKFKINKHLYAFYFQKLEKLKKMVNSEN